MRADRTILFSDLDGTLFRSSGGVSEENLLAIREYIDAGGHFALSTGRAPHNARRFIAGLPTNAPSIVFNGAGIYDFSVDRFASLRHLDKERTFPLFRWAVESVPELDLQLYTDDAILYATPLETAEPSFLEMHQPATYAPLDSLWKSQVVKALLLANHQEYNDLLGRRLEAAAPGNFDLKQGAVVMGEKYVSYFEVMPLDATKGAALRSLRGHPAAAGRTVLAVGDYWNDYELLREADVPLCPANAIDEIKALCRFVTVSNDEDAIAHILRHILPLL